MKAVKPFADMTAYDRRAYLKAAEAFFKPRLKEPFSHTKKKAADKRVSNSQQ